MDSIGSSSAAAPAGDGAPKIMSAKQQKLFDLRMRMNEGRKLNHMEVAAEKRRATDPLGEAKRQRELNEQRNERKRKETEDAEGGGEEGMEEEAKDEKKEKKEKDENRHLNVTLEQAEVMDKKKSKKDKGKAAFGWDVFNQDALHKAHKKRVKTALSNPDLVEYEKQKQEDPEFYRDANSLAAGGVGHKPTQEHLDAMVKDLMDAAERRSKFSRRRPEIVEADVDYINDRNKHFNKKIERAFGEYTKVIKENLERGTAL
mmetsp:Transcript_5274/g.12689  ORF Transcript_5274/g.12689 Transcript_5274/m.12689 type:complete len:259 (+) Transcript_5274:1-777(+)